MKVIELSQEAVEVKPGSKVNRLLILYKDLISTTSGPVDPDITGKSNFLLLISRKSLFLFLFSILPFQNIESSNYL